jgi:hypothetical protein
MEPLPRLRRAPCAVRERGVRSGAGPRQELDLRQPGGPRDRRLGHPPATPRRPPEPAVSNRSIQGTKAVGRERSLWPSGARSRKSPRPGRPSTAYRLRPVPDQAGGHRSGSRFWIAARPTALEAAGTRTDCPSCTFPTWARPPQAVRDWPDLVAVVPRDGRGSQLGLFGWSRRRTRRGGRPPPSASRPAA